MADDPLDDLDEEIKMIVAQGGGLGDLGGCSVDDSSCSGSSKPSAPAPYADFYHQDMSDVLAFLDKHCPLIEDETTNQSGEHGEGGGQQGARLEVQLIQSVLNKNPSLNLL